MSGADRAALGHFLLVDVGAQRYALPATDVQEVLARPALASIAGAPHAVLGLLRLRGALLPVVDLGVRLGLPAAPPRLDDRLVVVSLPEIIIGLVVNAVLGVQQIAAPSNLSRKEADNTDGLVAKVMETRDGVVGFLRGEALVDPYAYTWLHGLLANRGGSASLPSLHTQVDAR